MIEVFKTNVANMEQAENIVRDIHHLFTGYVANFDLHDCDNILRITASSGTIEAHRVIQFLSDDHHCTAEVLADEISIPLLSI